MVYAFRVRALGIDYGRRRIGLALSDATGLLARPWKTIATAAGGPSRAAGAPAPEIPGRAARAPAALAAEIAALEAEEDGLSAVAVGYPRKLNGEPNEQTAAVEIFAA